MREVCVKCGKHIFLKIKRLQNTLSTKEEILVEYKRKRKLQEYCMERHREMRPEGKVME